RAVATMTASRDVRTQHTTEDAAEQGAADLVIGAGLGAGAQRLRRRGRGGHGRHAERGGGGNEEKFQAHQVLRPKSENQQDGLSQFEPERRLYEYSVRNQGVTCIIAAHLPWL